MSTALTMYGKTGANAFGGETESESKKIDFITDAMKVALLSSSYTPNPDTQEVYGDLSNELAATHGYSTGGAALGSTVTRTVVYNATGNITVFDAPDTAFSASGGDITFRYAVVYDSTTTVLVGYLDFGSDQTIVDGNTGTIVWDATHGVFYAQAT